jgi:hypothetical protein
VREKVDNIWLPNIDACLCVSRRVLQCCCFVTKGAGSNYLGPRVATREQVVLLLFRSVVEEEVTNASVQPLTGKTPDNLKREEWRPRRDQ